MELLENKGLRLNFIYYITKQICPALSRVFSLMDINVFQWSAIFASILLLPQKQLKNELQNHIKCNQKSTKHMIRNLIEF